MSIGNDVPVDTTNHASDKTKRSADLSANRCHQDSIGSLIESARMWSSDTPISFANLSDLQTDKLFKPPSGQSNRPDNPDNSNRYIDIQPLFNDATHLGIRMVHDFQPDRLHVDEPYELKLSGTAGGKMPGDVSPESSEFSESPDHKRLSNWADYNLQSTELASFQKDMADFEERAKRDGLSQDEVVKTYEQIQRITEAAGDKPVSALQRQHIAQAVMHQAANPTDISQGSHGTCAVTTLECRIYTREPSAAAKLVADVALTGEYHAADGTAVKVDATPHDQSKLWPPQDGKRTHASEIFEVTAVNIHYAQKNAKRGTNIHYEQHEPTPGDFNDTGERLLDYSHTPPREKSKGTQVLRDPELHGKMVAHINNSIVGRDEQDVVLQAYGSTEGGVTAIHSEDELRAKLKELKDQHKLPVVVAVCPANEPFYTDHGGGVIPSLGGVAHVVTVTDYDESTNQVCVDNQWTKAQDHGKDNPIHAHDLYMSMLVFEDAEKILKQDVDWNKAHGIYDPQKEADLVRHKLCSEEISPREAETEDEKIIEEMFQHGKGQNVSLEEWKDIDEILYRLPPEAQLHLTGDAYSKHLISDDCYAYELRWTAFQIAYENKKAGRFFGFNPWADHKFNDREKQLQQAMAGLPEPSRNALSERIAKDVKDADLL